MALILAMGLVAHGAGMPDMALTSAEAVASDVPMSGTGKCNGCAGDEKGLVTAACAAFCNTVLPSASPFASVDVISAGRLGPTSEPIGAGRTTPPDPYPPRPADLS
jgi:hypothetical protein